jgi:hypothetical protein
MAYRYNPFTNNFDDVGVGGNGSVVLSAGTVSSPSLSFTGDSNNGIYSPGADNLAITTSGAERLRITSTGTLNIVGAGTAGSTQAVSFNGSAPVNSLVLDSSGYLGIGALPTFDRLEIAAGTYRGETIKCSTTAQRPTISFFNTADALAAYIQAAGNSLVFGSMGTDYGGHTPRMTLASTGLGVGVTSPAYKLELSTDSAGKPSSALWTITSDERIKEDIELADLDLCYEAIKTIPLKRYKWRDDVYSEEQVTDRRKLGWIAQDVETVFPKAVSIHEFKYNQVYETVTVPEVLEELDDEGNVIKTAVPEYTKQELVSEETIPDCKDLNADQIYAAMYGAIQKLIIKFEAFEERLDAAGIK